MVPFFVFCRLVKYDTGNGVLNLKMTITIIKKIRGHTIYDLNAIYRPAYGFTSSEVKPQLPLSAV